jgi:hypothetical protein
VSFDRIQAIRVQNLSVNRTLWEEVSISRESTGAGDIVETTYTNGLSGEAKSGRTERNATTESQQGLDSQIEHRVKVRKSPEVAHK